MPISSCAWIRSNLDDDQTYDRLSDCYSCSCGKNFGFGCMTISFPYLVLVPANVSKFKFPSNFWKSDLYTVRESTTSRCGPQPCHQAPTQAIANAVLVDLHQTQIAAGLTPNDVIFNIPSCSLWCDCRRICGCLWFYDSSTVVNSSKKVSLKSTS